VVRYAGTRPQPGRKIAQGADSIGRDHGLFYRCGVGAARHRRAVILAWSAAVLLAATLLPALLSSLGSPPLSVDGSQSARAGVLLEQGIPVLGSEQMLVVLHSAQLTAADPVYERTVNAVILAVGIQPGVTAVLPLPRPAASRTAAEQVGPFVFHGLPYRDPHNVYLFLGVKGSATERVDRFPAQRSAAVQAAGEASAGRVSAYVIGATGLMYDVRGPEVSDLRVVESVAVVLALAVLWLGSGALGAAAVPLLTALASIVIALGAFAAASPWTRFDVLLLTAITLTGLGVGIDYSLLVLSRFREELRIGHAPEHAAGLALATAGKTIACSGLLAGAAAASPFLIRMSIFREFAAGAVVVIAITLAAALTLVPAVLASGTGWLDWGRLPWRRRSDEPALSDEGIWARWARHLMRYPWPYLIGVGAALVTCAAPALQLRLGLDIERPVLTDTSSGMALGVLQHDSFSGASGTIFIVVSRSIAAPPPQLQRLTTALAADREVASVGVAPGRGLTVVAVVPRTALDSPATAALVRAIRARIAPATVPSAYPVTVGGSSAVLVDVYDEVIAKLPWVIGSLLTASLLFLTVMFRSLLIPLKAVAMNLLAMGTAYGIVALVFEDGWGAGIFGFARTGTIQVYMVLLTFVILFGLSLDYEIFLVRRIQEVYRITGDNTRAVAAGLQRTSRPIFLAAAIMVVVFSGLLTSQFPELKELGLALVIAFAVDATLIRLVLVPALMHMLGDWNWWLPRPLARFLPPVRPLASGAGTPEAPQPRRSRPAATGT
jgi:uncharacterized membrane protein YdfJ with MMPL/SSD domain